MSDGGKGSAPRPYSVSQEQFASNWDLIFKNKQKEKYSASIRLQEQQDGRSVHQNNEDSGERAVS